MIDTVTDSKEHIDPSKPIAYSVYHRLINRYVFAGQFVEGKVVLDAGCGCGLGTGYWVSKGAKRVIGVDINSEAIQRAREWNKNPEFIVADIQALPFEDNSFDTIMALEVIEHLEDAGAFLVECQRLLNEGGQLVCCTSNRDVVSPFLKKPRNPYRTKEFNLQEFSALMSSYFKHTGYYEQRMSDSRAKFRLVAAADSLITIVAGKGRLRAFLIKLGSPVLAQPHYTHFNQDFWGIVDNHYAVTHHNNEIPETLVVVARKEC